jgi:predicted secreted hydrolase
MRISFAMLLRVLRPGFQQTLRVLCSVCLLSSSAAPGAQNYRLALPGYHYSFPHDHFNHPDFETEWWYYTGNLQSADGHKFGFELTFFRQAVARNLPNRGPWDVQDIYLAHLALSDLSGGRFYHTERTNRSGPGVAGVDEAAQRIWNGNWQIRWNGVDQALQAINENFDLRFAMHPEKPPVINGENGVSQKAEGAGRASHYISLTRLDTKGTITLNTKTFSVSGLAWMDHEFFTHQLTPNQAGWDWLSLQLDDRSELMLFHIRHKDGSIDQFSAGTYVDAQGNSTHLRNSDFVLQPGGETWESKSSGAKYPIQWKIFVPRLGIELEAKTPLPSQELTGDSRLAPTYWEGAIVLRGKRSGAPISGVGYLEMTGYTNSATSPIP